MVRCARATEPRGGKGLELPTIRPLSNKFVRTFFRARGDGYTKIECSELVYPFTSAAIPLAHTHADPDRQNKDGKGPLGAGVNCGPFQVIQLVVASKSSKRGPDFSKRPSVGALVSRAVLGPTNHYLLVGVVPKPL